MNTTESLHSEMVRTLVKPGQQIIDKLTPIKAHLWHMSSALCGEAGELFDAFKKHIIYNKPLDMKNVIEEMGDAEFYLEGLRQHLGINRSTVLEANREKLSERYGNKFQYSDEAARARADKQEAPANYAADMAQRISTVLRMVARKATHVAHWPGDDVAVCQLHLDKLVYTANSMGFNLSSNELPANEDRLCVNCLSEIQIK